MATMEQIAKIAGVSRGTVDRVLNHRGMVRPETERRIVEVANALNYVPNIAARNLSFSKLNLILGVVVFNPAKVAFFKQVCEGIDRKVKELLQYNVRVEIRYGDIKSQNRMIDELVELGVAGIVIYGFNREETRQKIAELADKGIPVITGNTDITESRRLAFVGCDYYRAGRLAGHLVNLFLGGKGRVEIVLGADAIECLQVRSSGFQDYLREKAPEIEVSGISKNNPDDFTLFAAMETILESDTPPEAILVDSGNCYGACRAVELFAGEKKPILICYDMLEGTEEMLRKGIITATIVQQPQLQGSRPLELLLDYLAVGVAPEKEYNYTELQIKTAENL